MSISLYEVSAEFRSIAAQLEAMDIDEQTVADTLEGARYPVEQKGRAVAMVIANLDATAAAYANHAKQAADRAKAISKRADWLKQYLLVNMEACGMTEISGFALTVKIRNNPASVEIFDDALIPAEFMRQPEPPPPAPDKKAIAAAIKAGTDVAGARMKQCKRLEIV